MLLRPKQILFGSCHSHHPHPCFPPCRLRRQLDLLSDFFRDVGLQGEGLQVLGELQSLLGIPERREELKAAVAQVGGLSL